MPHFKFLRSVLTASFALLALAAVPSAASAQYIGAAPPPPAAPIPGVAEHPSEALARNVRLLALSPRSFEALIGAGRAALAVGDTQAAVGFFGRAEEVNPRSPGPKAGTAAALVAMEQPTEALGYFAEAMRLGATQASIGADRGLAYDLTGEPALAQADYRAALLGQDRDEARRRLALSLAMGRDRGGALAALAPLMSRRDPATERVRAFVFALVGDVASARRVVDDAMPGASANMAPFLQKLSRMTRDQQVAAVHFGRFPEDSAIKLAGVTPPPVSQQAPRGGPAPRVAVTRSAPKERAAPKDARRAPPAEMTSRTPLELRAQPVYSTKPAASGSAPTVAPTVEPIIAPPKRTPIYGPVAPLAAPTTSQAAPLSAFETPVATSSIAAETIEPQPPPPVEVAAATSTPASDRLSDIDALLGSANEPIVRLPTTSSNDEIAAAAAPPRSKFEIDIPTDEPATKKGKSKPDAVAEVSPKKAKPAPKTPKSPGKYWVQLAGGSKTERMPTEFKRIKGKKPALFAKRTPYVAELKGWTRLLVGPFKSENESQEYVNQLAKANIDGFSWTSPSGQAIEKLPPK